MNAEIKRQSIERIANKKTENHFSKCRVVFISFIVIIFFSMIIYVESVEDRIGKIKIEIRSLQSEIKYFQRALNLEEADK
jgi:cell division protein FtsL